MSDPYRYLKILTIRNTIRIILVVVISTYVINQHMVPAIVLSVIDTSEPATYISWAIAFFVVLLTGITVYLSFGPPSKQLADPFEDHED
jgi:PsbN protein